MSTFRGFSRPQYTQIPNDFLDEHMHKMTAAELKCLLYIMRRTLGFGKSADNISLDQFTDGIVLRDGTRLDHGAGVSRPSAKTALASLAASGYIVIEKNFTDRGTQAATTYRLNLAPEDDDSAVETTVKGGAKTLPLPGDQGGKNISGEGQKHFPSRGKNFAPQKKEQNKDTKERGSDPKSISGGSSIPDRRPPLTRKQMHALDPVADRDLILRAKIEPEPPAGATLDELVAWEDLRTAWKERKR